MDVVPVFASGHFSASETQVGSTRTKHTCRIFRLTLNIYSNSVFVCVSSACAFCFLLFFFFLKRLCKEFVTEEKSNSAPFFFWMVY